MFAPTLFNQNPKRIALAVAVALTSYQSFADDSAPIESTADDMEVIVVSGTRSQKALKDVAGSISVVTQEEIEKQVVNDMNQLFKYDPSIQVTGSVGKAQNINVRGMGGDRVLIIKDGMRTNDGYGANGLNDIVGRGFIETDTLKQVEVAKGAASSLYGADALAGIVVFTTKDASDYLSEGENFATRVKAGYNDSDEQYNVGTTLAHKVGDFEHLLNLTYRDGHEQQNYEASEDPFDIDSNSVLYNAKYHLTDKDTLSLSIDHWQQNTDGDSADGLLFYFRGLAPYGYNIAKENSSNTKETNAYKLGYQSHTSNAFYDHISISLYTNDSSQSDEEYGQLDINAPLFGVVEIRDMWKTADFSQDTTGLLSQATKLLNKQHRLSYGLDIEQTDSERTLHEYREVAGNSTKDDTTQKFPKTETNRMGIFINDEIKLLDGKLTVTPGLRFDSYDMDPNGALKTNGEEFKKYDDDHTTFNLSSIYKLTDNISVFAQYGQGFKVPAYDLAYIEHYNQPTSTYVYEIVPSDDLSPEESDSYEIGIRGISGDFAFSGAIYYNKYSNFLATQLVSSTTVLDSDGAFDYQHDVYQYQNIDDVTIKGAEIGLTYYINNTFSVFANASYQDGKDDSTDDYITSISPLSGIAGVSYDSENLSSELVLNWADNMTKVNEGEAEVAGYGVVDWLVNYQVTPALTVNMAVNNVFDKEYIRYNSIAGHANDDSSLSQYAEPGRSVSANIYYSF